MIIWWCTKNFVLNLMSLSVQLTHTNNFLTKYKISDSLYRVKIGRSLLGMCLLLKQNWWCSCHCWKSSNPTKSNFSRKVQLIHFRFLFLAFSYILFFFSKHMDLVLQYVSVHQMTSLNLYYMFVIVHLILPSRRIFVFLCSHSIFPQKEKIGFQTIASISVWPKIHGCDYKIQHTVCAIILLRCLI